MLLGRLLLCTPSAQPLSAPLACLAAPLLVTDIAPAAVQAPLTVTCPAALTVIALDVNADAVKVAAAADITDVVSAANSVTADGELNVTAPPLVAPPSSASVFRFPSTVSLPVDVIDNAPPAAVHVVATVTVAAAPDVTVTSLDVTVFTSIDRAPAAVTA